MADCWRWPRCTSSGATPTRADDDPRALLTTTTIFTTRATDVAGRVHERMPLATDSGDFEAWLNPEHTDPSDPASCSNPADGDLTVRPVSTAVNSVRNNGPELLAPVPDPAPPGDGA